MSVEFSATGIENDFENELSVFCGVSFSVAAKSAFAAGKAALAALGIEPGDSVVVANDCSGAVLDALSAHNVSVVKPIALNEVIDSVAAVVISYANKNTEDVAMLIDQINEQGVIVIEDVGDMFGTMVGKNMVGSLGDIAICDFSPDRSFGATGDAGVVLTASRELAVAAREFLVVSDELIDPDQADLLSYSLKAMKS